MRPRRYPSDPPEPPPAPAPRAVVLVKLGGSLITDKTRPGAARPEVIHRLARELAETRRTADTPRIVLGHGSGSFGHVAAERHGLAGGIAVPEPGGSADPELLAGIAETQARAAELHRRVLAELAAAGVPAFSIAPSSALVTAGVSAVELAAEPVALALRLGLVPVIYGDVVLDRVQGVAICSTERMLLALAERLPALGWRAERALWLGATAGVLAPDGRPIAELSEDDAAAAAAAGDAEGTDVTGGMRHRVDTALALARRGVESWILDGRKPGTLVAALAGRPTHGTHVRRA